MNTISPDKIAQVFVLLFTAFLGGLIFLEFIPYFSGALGALTLFVLLKNYQQKLENLGLKPGYTAVLLILASILIILIPITLIVFLLISKVSKAVENSDKIFAIVKERARELEDALGFEIIKDNTMQQAGAWVSQHIGGFAGSTFTVFISLGIMYFILFYMLKKREPLKNTLLEYIPISRKNLVSIWKELEVLIKSHALGIPIVAFAQGLVFLIGLIIVGAPDLLFWFVIAVITSLIPYGTALTIVPVSILLFSQDSQWGAIFIIAYGTVVVGLTDNLIRMTILKKLEDIHPLIILIGVMIGVPLFGFIGIIFGPLLISLFMLMVKLYKKEYGK